MSVVKGIKGLASGVFYENVASKYRYAKEAIASSNEETEYNLGGRDKLGYITIDIYTSFVILVGIFFPSCTGKRNLIYFKLKSSKE